jgi:hypothetical protein
MNGSQSISPPAHIVCTVALHSLHTPSAPHVLPAARGRSTRQKKTPHSGKICPAKKLSNRNHNHHLSLHPTITSPKQLHLTIQSCRKDERTNCKPQEKHFESYPWSLSKPFTQWITPLLPAPALPAARLLTRLANARPGRPESRSATTVEWRAT